MGEVGPATLEEVAEVLGERLGFLRRDPPDRRYGRVLVGSIEESRGQEFAVVFLPGLAEGLFPQKALEDPLLLDVFRKAADENLPLRHHRVDQERVALASRRRARRAKNWWRPIRAWTSPKRVRAFLRSMRWNCRARFKGACRS